MMSSLDMAPPLAQEHNQEEGAEDLEQLEPKLNSNPPIASLGSATAGAAKPGFIREDWSQALQKFVEVNPNTATLGAAPAESEIREEAVGEGEEAMEVEAEPMAADSGEVAAAVVAEPVSEAAAADGDPEVEEAAPTAGDVEEKALEGEEAAAPTSGDVQDKALESGGDVVSASENGDNGDGAGVESAEEKSVEPATEVSNESAEKVEGEAVDAPVVTEDVEVNSEAAAEVSGEGAVEESSSVKIDGAPVEEVVPEAEPNEELTQVEALPPSKDIVEEKAAEVKEEASAEAPAEESLNNAGSGAADAPGDEIADVGSGAADAPVGEIADVVDAEPEEEPASQEGVSSKASEDEPAEGVDGSVEGESMEKAQPGEGLDAHVEEVATSGDVEAVEADARDLNEGGNEEASPEAPCDALDAAASVDEAVAATGAEPVVESEAAVESVPVQEKVVEVNSEEASQEATPDSEARDAHVEAVVEETTSAEPNEEVSELGAVSAPSDNVEAKSVEMNSEAGAHVEEASPAEEAPPGTVISDAPVEETADAATSAEPDVQSVSEQVEPQVPASEPEEQTTTMAISTEEELFDLFEWESKNRATSDAVPDNSLSLSAPSETVVAEDRSFQVEELPQESPTQSIPTEVELNEGEVESEVTAEQPPTVSSTEEVLSVPIEHTSEEPSDALAEPCDKDPLTDELEHPTASAAGITGSEAKELPSIDDDVADETIKSVGDLSHLLKTVMTDEEVKAAAAVRSPDEAGTPVLEAETVRHEECEASEASQVETVSREFNLDDLASTHVVTPDIAAASSEVGAPKSYSLEEVATHLHDAAAKALHDAEASDSGEKQSSVAKTVAQIVLEESSHAKDSSEYISEVVQHVAQFAQDAGQSDPNVLPDTVARIFDGETAASPANQVTQSKETTSLGTMVSLFVIWCVSLCASRVSSKDMPAPALKLAAEEVTAVLHSSVPSQPTPAQGTATSSH